jgi:hypothetical protein
MSRPVRIKIAVVAGGILVGTCFVWLCGGSSGPPVQFVLPDGYTGPVILVLDPKNGTEFLWADDKYRVDIPAGGVLRVRTFDPFERWHQETWNYATGKAIPIASHFEKPDPEAIMVRLGNSAVSGGGRWMEHFVGTEAQLDVYLRTPHENPK